MDKIFKFFPKAAQAAVSFQNPIYSPARDKRVDWHDHKHRAYLNRNFSGPIMSLVPADSWSKSRNFDTQEPTSPKVSCMGQVKHKNKFCPRNKSKESKPEKKDKPAGPKTEKNGKNRPELKKQTSTIKKIFSIRRKSDASSNDHVKALPAVPCNAPRLGQMRKYASSRDTLAGFNWTIAQVGPDDREYFSDVERVCDDDDCDFKIPFSAPVKAAELVLEPRKEINLWKRRTMAQPKPLQLNMAARAP